MNAANENVPIVVYLGTRPYRDTQDVDLFEAYAAETTLVHVDPDLDSSLGEPAFSHDLAAVLQAGAGESAVIQTTLPALLPGGRFHAVSSINRWWAVRTLIADLRKIAAQRQIAVVMQRPTLLPTLRGLGADVAVYEVRDDYAALEHDPAKARRVAAAHGRMIRSNDLVWTTSKVLADDARALSPTPDAVYESSNGVQFENFCAAASSAIPGALASIDRPRIGAIGVLNDRIDIELIVGAAERHADWNFVLIGPVAEASEQAARALKSLAELANVYLLPSVSHESIPAHIAGFDVAMIPYRINDATRRINPYKVYQYLAVGKAVVATPLPSLLKHNDLIHVCENLDDFCDAVSTLLNRTDDTEAVARRQDRAREYDWGVIARRRLDILRAHLENPPLSNGASALTRAV